MKVNERDISAAFNRNKIGYCPDAANKIVLQNTHLQIRSADEQKKS